MSGAHITIEVDNAAVLRALGDLIRRVQDPSGAMAEIGEHLQRTTQDRFASQRAPSGAPWAPNTEVTRARKVNPNILTESGLLGDLIRWQLADGGRGVEVGSDRAYAAVQHFGQPQGASGKTKRGGPIPWGDIPARPFLGLSAADERAILAILRDSISGH